MRKKKQWCRIWVDRLVSEIQQERWYWRHLTKKDMDRERRRSRQRHCTITWTQEKKPTGTLQQASPCSSTGFPLCLELHNPPVASLLICEFLGSVRDECWILVGRMPSPLALGLSLIWTISSWWFAYFNSIQRTRRGSQRLLDYWQQDGIQFWVWNMNWGPTWAPQHAFC